MAANPRSVTAQDLTMSPLPPIVPNPDRTFSKSVSPQRFVGLMAKWTNFEKEVRGNFHRQPWANSRRPVTWDPDLIVRDRVKCASEAGVTGRFLQHVGQVMSCVGRELRQPVYFGDWRGRNRSDIPDVTIWTEDQESCTHTVAGEMKTPWTCDLRELMSEDRAADPEEFEEDFTLWAGQVANYMRTYRYKYGFLSTYDETVFFKQETHILTGAWANANGVPHGTEKTVLYYSNAIHFDTAFIACNPATVQDPRAFVDRVTLRECMLYLMTQVTDDPRNFSFRNTERSDKWTRQGTSGAGIAKNFAPDPSKGKYAANPSAPQSSSSKGKGREQQAHPRATDSLAHNMNGLSMKDVRDPRQQMMTWPERDVRWDQKRGTFLYRVDSKAYPVDKYEQRDGILMIKIQNKNYRGRKV